jgi:hypothetical protein
LQYSSHCPDSLPAGLLYLHDKNCARNVLICQVINYIIFKGFYGLRKGRRPLSDNICHFFQLKPPPSVSIEENSGLGQDTLNQA